MPASSGSRTKSKAPQHRIPPDCGCVDGEGGNVHRPFTYRPRFFTRRALALRTVGSMREAFREELEAVFGALAAICDQVEGAVTLATQALLGADEEVAASVISADEAID